MKEGLISIITLCYNHANFIKEMIESIWNQDYQNIEIIAIDDGSSDASPEILTELAKQSKVPMQVILQENTGRIGLNLNRAAAKASGEFIMYTSCDDKYAPNICSKLVNEIQKNNNIQFVFATKSIKFYTKDGKVMSEPNHQTFDPMAGEIQDLLDTEMKTACLFWIQNTLFRKSIIDKVNGYEEDMVGDDIVLRIKVLKEIQNNPSMTYSFINEVGFYYRMHENNIHKNHSRQIQIIREVQLKYFPNIPSPVVGPWLLHGARHHLIHEGFKVSVKFFISEMKKNRAVLSKKDFTKYILKYIRFVIKNNFKNIFKKT